MFRGGNRGRGKYRKREGHFNKKKLYAANKKKNAEDEEISQKQAEYAKIIPDQVKLFTDLPLSQKTLSILEKAGYTAPTDIQRESIGLSLQGHDVLGAAKTGSGKTLAFLVPILESLWRARWTQYDGLGALIISPTRELAYQTFDVLRKIGASHDFSAGLVIGGKHVKEESERMNTTNIVVCTPGRLLQHMDETYGFNADSLQILVLDEADRILDLGFRDTMNAIIDNLPSSRQTLLFSATQTKSVKDLARLSLKDAMFVSVHEKAAHSTPQRLQQSFIVCELEEKLNVLWSFIKHHLKHKILVFLSSCKQTRFVYEVFRRFRPGVTVLSLHGAMQQLRRVAVYDEFCRKQHAVLFATDIAARGLDFPAVHWVVQLDCPEDANTYIHRAGRTARYEDDGEALLLLLPSEEEAMVKQLEEKKIPINRIKVNPRKNWSIDTKLQSLLASDVQLKEFAQRAFVSYIRSVFLMKNKKIFDVNALNTNKYAGSLGLAVPPRIRFLNKEKQKKKTNTESVTLDSAGHSSDSDSDESDNDSNDDDETNDKTDEAEKILMKGVEKCETRTKKKSKKDKKSKTKTDDSKIESVKTKVKSKSKDEEDEDEEDSGLRFEVDEDDELFSVRKNVQLDLGDDEIGEEPKRSELKEKPATKISVAKKVLKKNVQVNTRIRFDEEGEAEFDPLKQRKDEQNSDADEYEGGLDLVSAKKRMMQEDTVDKEIHRQKIKLKHREERLKEKEKKRDEAEKKKMKYFKEVPVVLGSDDDGASGDSDADAEALDYDSHDDDRFSASDNDDDDDDDDEEDDDDDEDEETSLARKRRRIEPDDKDDTSSDDDADSGSNDEDKMEEGPSLETDEALAAKLLGLS